MSLRIGLLACLAAAALAAQDPGEIPINAPYVETPHDVVAAMLKVAGVGKTDVVYDLGCGDGRIVITAARDFGARGVGVEHSPERIRDARGLAQKAGVAGRVEFRDQDLYDADIHDATVVAIYLLPAANLRLRPKLLKELKPGARIVSHTFDMGDWKPDRTVDMRGTKLYLWVIPVK
jgi:SAM-dependent methyltransferase